MPKLIDAERLLARMRAHRRALKKKGDHHKGAGVGDALRIIREEVERQVNIDSASQQESRDNPETKESQ